MPGSEQAFVRVYALEKISEWRADRAVFHWKILKFTFVAKPAEHDLKARVVCAKKYKYRDGSEKKYEEKYWPAHLSEKQWSEGCS